MAQPAPLPLYSDNISTVHLTLSDVTNVSTLQVSPTQLTLNDGANLMNLNISSVNFSDSNGYSAITTTSLALNTSSSTFSLSGVDSSYEVTTPGSLNLNASTVLLNGVAAPGAAGESFITNGENGLQWSSLSITDFLHLEAGIFNNVSSLTSVIIPFNSSYPVAPSVLLTPNADGSGNIVPVALDNVNVNNFSVVFGSSALKKFSFAVLPNNNTYIPPV